VLSANLIDNIVRHVVARHRVIGPVIDIESGLAAVAIGTFGTIPEGPETARRFIQANPVMGTKSVPCPLSVDGMPLFFHD
jgi:hypothetical protein